MSQPVGLFKENEVRAFDRVIEWLVVVLFAFMPLSFGAVEAWSEQVVIVLATIIGFTFLARLLLLKRTDLSWSWGPITAILFLVLVILQLIPWPISVIRMMSPNTAALKSQFLELSSGPSAPRNTTISFYPCATRHDLRLLLAAVTVFWVVFHVYRRPDQIRRLLRAIAVIGGAVAAVALAQDVYTNGKIYWFVPTGYPLAWSGTFIHNGHFGQFLNLSIGAALGLILLELRELSASQQISPFFMAEYLCSRRACVLWGLILMILMSVTAVLVSMTRGGVVSLLGAALITSLVWSRRTSLHPRARIAVLVALSAFACVLYIGFDALHERLNSVDRLEAVHEDIGKTVQADVRVWLRFPLLGSGLGTRAVVAPIIASATSPPPSTYAVNEYVRILEETGMLGLGILVVFGVIVWRAYRINVSDGVHPIGSVAYGLGLGLLAVLLHSVTDFGQNLPANAMLSAVFCALLLAMAKTQASPSGWGRLGRPSPEHSSRKGPLALFGLVLAGQVWSLESANRARLAESRWAEVLRMESSLIQEARRGQDERYVELLRHATAAVEYQPDNIHYVHWLNCYRWQSLHWPTDPNGDDTIVRWNLRLTQRIADQLEAARGLCPTFGPTYCVLGQLEYFVLGRNQGAEHIRTGYQLASYDPTSCYVSGLLDAEEGNFDATLDKFRKAVDLDPSLFEEIARSCIHHLGRPEWALLLAGEEMDRLSRLAILLETSDKAEPLVQNVRAWVMKIVENRSIAPNTSAWDLAQLGDIYRMQRRPQAALESYRHALVLDQNEVSWRLAVAKLLKEEGRIADAFQEARLCLRIQPDFAPAQKLLEELSVLPDPSLSETGGGTKPPKRETDRPIEE